MAPITQRINLKKASSHDANINSANGGVHERHKRHSVTSQPNTSATMTPAQRQKEKEARGKRSILAALARWLPWRRAQHRQLKPDEAVRHGELMSAVEGSASLDEPLEVNFIDYMIRDNCYEHWTDSFTITNTTDKDDSNEKARLVVRRGQTFKLRIIFNRPIRKDDDIINLTFTLANTDKLNYQTHIVTPVLEDHLIVGLASDSAWHSRLSSVDGASATISVSPSAKAVVGEWTIDVDTRSRKDINLDRSISKHTAKKNIFILFNPWCKQDPVYIKDRDAVRDYVLNDSGIIYRGSHNSIRPVAWVFGQYEKHVLEATIWAMYNLGSLAPSDGGDPIKVVRHLSSVVHNDDKQNPGIVQGFWPEDGRRNAYKGGTNPYDFTGSKAILQQYHKTHKPVKYGQCWVFAGVATTMCRALGIPSRPVTNYRSAHDTNQSLTVDYLFDEREEQIVLPRRDSVWNFHVWTEAWLTRPDLASAGVYDGWQVVDATPQEQSDGRYQMGPASVEACRRGEITKHFDTKFLYAEVNADETEWVVHNERPDEPIKLLAYRTDSIGVLIITKAIGSQYREDLTNRYKHQEKTKEEREVMLRALRLCKNQFSRYTINEVFGNVKFDLQLPDDVVIGESFRAILRMKNPSRKTYTIPSTIVVASTTYTGQIVHVCKRTNQINVLAPGQEELITVTLDYDDYAKHLVDQNSFIVQALARIEDTEYEFFKKETFRLRMPDILIQVDGPLKERKSFKCTLTLSNPLPKPITKGVFYLEGPGLGKQIKIPVKGKIGVNEQAQVNIMLTPKSSGTKLIVAKFRSKQLNDVDGYKEIRVHPLSVWSAYDRIDPVLT